MEIMHVRIMIMRILDYLFVVTTTVFSSSIWLLHQIVTGLIADKYFTFTIFGPLYNDVTNQSHRNIPTNGIDHKAFIIRNACSSDVNWLRLVAVFWLALVTRSTFRYPGRIGRPIDWKTVHNSIHCFNSSCCQANLLENLFAFSVFFRPHIFLML